jgi:hypothetical protein
MDTISFKLLSSDVPGIDMFKHATSCLTCIDNGYRYGYRYIRGKLKNFDVLVTDNYLKIYSGSLSKFYLDSNLTDLTSEDICKSVYNLSDYFQLPIERSFVQKLHYGINTIVDYDTTLYYPYLGNLGAFKRLEQPFGLNYKVQNRELVIYDKIRELKAHREPIPSLFKDKHVIRVEMRYHRKLNDYFKLSEFRASTLFNPTFLDVLKNDLKTTYSKIPKIYSDNTIMEEITTKRQLYLAGIEALIEKEGGILKAINKLKERYKKGLLTKKQFFDLKNIYNNCGYNKTSCLYANSNLIEEFDSKFFDS